jgi:hypothetical protein
MRATSEPGLSARAPVGPASQQTPDLARQVVAQLSEVVQRRGSNVVELTLNPVELGRVRLSLVPGDGIMSVSILADRPETLDLMRRHIDLLAQDFRDMGYASASFSFGRGHEEAPSPPPSDTGTAGVLPVPQTQSTPSGAHPAGLSDRIDIRL